MVQTWFNELAVYARVLQTVVLVVLIVVMIAASARLASVQGREPGFREVLRASRSSQALLTVFGILFVLQVIDTASRVVHWLS